MGRHNSSNVRIGRSLVSVCMGLIFFLGSAFIAPSVAKATFMQATFSVEGIQEVPPNASPASGIAEVTYNSVSDLLMWDISYADLMGVLTAAHFHGPAPAGINAGVQVPIPIGLSPLIGSAFITDAQGDMLMNGLMYINLHTTAFPGGEIRGQVIGVPEPSSIIIFGAGLAGIIVMRRRFNK